MCTATWLQDAERFRLFCNRDELRHRTEALPPQPHYREGIAYLAPIDGDAGGTWIAVNDHGLALCLLNDYRSPVADRPGGFTSRGLLVAGLATVTNTDALVRRWSEIDLVQYRPFTLLALTCREAALLLTWNGSDAWVRGDGFEPPLSSSSFDDLGAATMRHRLFAELARRGRLGNSERLVEFHCSHLPERGPFSVCMHRPDASTVSLTVIEVDSQRATLSYAAGPPCSTSLGPALRLDLVDVGVEGAR